MLLRKAFKFRLKTDSNTRNTLAQIAGNARFVWNRSLALQKAALDAGEQILNYGQICQRLTEWRKEEDISFLAKTSCDSQQQKLRDLDRAIRDAFDKSSPKRFPRFKRKGNGDSFRCVGPKQFSLDGNRVRIPKLGWLRFYKSQEIVGAPKNITVSKHGDHWFVSVQTEQTVAVPVHPSTGAVGIDMGIARFATLSDGTKVKPLNSFKRLEKKLAKAQRILARRLKFSSNWKKQKRKIQRIHTRIADDRNDFLHKISSRIASENQAVILEDLKVSNMSASARGTVEAPGSNVKAKTGLNRSILDQGWYEFRRQIAYKLGWLGGLCVLVNPAYTSMKCSHCGYTHKDNRKGLKFVCGSCHVHLDADINAALNILAVGQTVLACGETGTGRFDEAGTSGKGRPITASVALSN